MKANVISIDGIDAAIISLMMSKRSYTQEKADNIMSLVRRYNRCQLDEEASTELQSHLKKLVKYGLKMGHETLLRFIDLTCIVEGLHRGGQDDVDAHAYRMNNRIIRASTRLGDFDNGEMSSWYKGKIIGGLDANITITGVGDIILKDGIEYVKSPFGYVRKDLARNRDVMRGNYPLSIPSNCIFKINFIDFRHIYKVRGEHGHAHPEVKECIEMLADDVERKLPVLGQYVRLEFTEKGTAHVSDVVKLSREEYNRLRVNSCKCSKLDPEYLKD